MKIQLKSGFTIIEVMLFLAITGLLIGGILAGTNQSLNTQRYRSAVEDLRNTITAQYATSLSLRNLTEDSSGNTTSGLNSVDPCSVIDGAGGIETHVARGSSNCLYVGRLILLSATSSEQISQLKVYPVVAKVLYQGISGIFRNESGDLLPTLPADEGPVTDQNSLQVAAFTRNSNLVIDKPVDWGLVAVEPSTDNIQNVGILVFRSPLSGSITTYIIKDTDSLAPGYLNDLNDHMNPDVNIGDLKLCMADLTGPLDQASRQAILIKAGATGPSDVERLGEAAEC